MKVWGKDLVQLDRSEPGPDGPLDPRHRRRIGPLGDSVEFDTVLADAGYDVQTATFDGAHEAPSTELAVQTIVEVMDSSSVAERGPTVAPRL